MPYQDHFKLADDMISHLNTVIGGITDPFVSSRYVGFVSLSAVTVYELAIKHIFISFAAKEHPVLENFTQIQFRRINGRIRTDDLKGYLDSFGKKYTVEFLTLTKNAEISTLRLKKRSMLETYKNLIEWRHLFVHQGQIPSTVTYQEVVEAYELGKDIIHCLDKAMQI